MELLLKRMDYLLVTGGEFDKNSLIFPKFGPNFLAYGSKYAIKLPLVDQGFNN